MARKNIIKNIFNAAIFDDDEKNRIAEIINTVAIVLIVGLVLILTQRFIFEKINFLIEVIFSIVLIAASTILLRYNKIVLSGFLVIIPLLGLAILLAWEYDGLHDYALFAIPGLLVIAGFIFRKVHFFIFLTICLLVILIIGVAEMSGVLQNDLSRKTKLFDIVDVLVIISLTAITIRMFSERLRKSLITARANEQEIKESEQKIRALMTALPDLVIRISAEGIVRDLSAPNSFNFHYRKEDLLGKSIAEIFPEETSDVVLKATNKALEGKNVEQFEYRLNIGNLITDWEIRIVSLDQKDVLAVVRDISERKRTEEALKLSEEIFDSFMEYSPVYVFFKDQDTRAIRLSKNYEMMLGMPLEKILGKTMMELFPSELAKNMTDDDMNIIKNGKMIRIVEELGDRIFETVKFPISVHNRPQFLAGFTIDITDIKRNEERLKQYARELKEVNASKEKFFSIIAHDLRSPFLGILGSIQMLTDDYTLLSDIERKSLIERIGSSIKKTFELLENLLHWSRMQSGKIGPNPVEIIISEEIRPVITLLKELSHNKNIHIECTINDTHRAKIDKDMFKTVSRNLISNAIKFSIPGGRIIISSEENGDNIVVSFKDNGIGMDRDTLEGLFKTDNTKSRLGTSNESGTGIGLMVCKEMIELNRGTIWAESEEGTGSVFSFSIPKS